MESLRYRRYRVAELTQDEAEAVQHLSIQSFTFEEEDDEVCDVGGDIIASFHKKQKTERVMIDEYVDCSFIIGSAAEIEQVWSFAEYILNNFRTRMSPMLLEALLFLKVNYDFWDLSLVAKAIKEVDQDSQNAR